MYFRIYTHLVNFYRLISFGFLYSISLVVLPAFFFASFFLNPFHSFKFLIFINFQFKKHQTICHIRTENTKCCFCVCFYRVRKKEELMNRVGSLSKLSVIKSSNHIDIHHYKFSVFFFFFRMCIS